MSKAHSFFSLCVLCIYFFVITRLHSQSNMLRYTLLPLCIFIYTYSECTTKMIIVHSVCIQRKNPSIDSFSLEWIGVHWVWREFDDSFFFESFKIDWARALLSLLLLWLVCFAFFLFRWLLVREMLWKFIETALRSPAANALHCHVKIHIFSHFSCFLFRFIYTLFFIKIYTHLLYVYVEKRAI